MRGVTAVTVVPRAAGSAGIRRIPLPAPGPGQVCARLVASGICGTDAEIVSGEYGQAPPGEEFLVLGHEALGEIEQCGPGVQDLHAGDLVVPTVRRPGSCENCRAGEPDMCRARDYTERGIWGSHGFMAERFVEDPAYLVRVPRAFRRTGVLLEPLSIVEKGLDQIHHLQRRLRWSPRSALILGPGTIGLLAAVLLRHRGLEVTLVGLRAAGDLPEHKRRVIETIGAVYRSSRETPVRALGRFDVTVEATGHSRVAFEAMQTLDRNGVLCLMSVTGGDETLTIPSDRINREIVLGNKLIFGTVNANRRHLELGVRHLGEIEERWPGLLEGFITKRFPLDRFEEALSVRSEHLKIVLEP